MAFGDDGRPIRRRIVADHDFIGGRAYRRPAVTHSRASFSAPGCARLGTLDRNKDCRPACGRTRRPPGAGPCRRVAARWRCHGAVHRALPQGGHRGPGRHATARTGNAAGLSARARSPPRRGGQEHRRAGQADAGAAGCDRRGTDQAGTRGPVRTVQGKAPHEGRDRARSRSRTVGREAVRRSIARSMGRGGGVRQCRRRVCRRARGARWRARPARRTLGRGCGAGRWPARMVVGRGPVRVQAGGRQGRERRRGRQVPRLLRPCRADRTRAIAPCSGGVPWAGAGSARCAPGDR